MSAMSCSDQHLNYLLAAWAAYFPGEDFGGSYPRPDDAFRMLRSTNEDALDYCYPNRETPADAPVPPLRRVRVEPVVVLKAIQFYEYQCCDLPDFYKGSSADFCAKLRERAITMLGGWDAAPWGIDDWQPKGGK